MSGETLAVDARCVDCGHTEKAHVGGCYVCRQAGDRCRTFMSPNDSLPTAPSGEEQTDERDPYFVLDFCRGAIMDAIGLEDGLDGAAGSAVIAMIDASLAARASLSTEQRAAMLDRVARAAGSLRETGAGRGEALTAKEVAALDDVLGVEGERGPDYNGYLDSLDIARAAVRRLAATPEGGAPTEELTEEDERFARSVIGWATTAGWHPNNIERLRSRLTRSPRAAGEPTQELTDDEGLAALDARWLRSFIVGDRLTASDIEGFQSIASRFAAGAPSDTERLDWIDAQTDVVVARGEWSDMTTQTSVCSEGDAPRLPFVHAPTTREAIDAAMRPAAPPPERAP